MVTLITIKTKHRKTVKFHHDIVICYYDGHEKVEISMISNKRNPLFLIRYSAMQKYFILLFFLNLGIKKLTSKLIKMYAMQQIGKEVLCSSTDVGVFF